jgi:hypothetical protein
MIGKHDDNNDRNNDKSHMMSSSLSPTARHSNRKHHSATTTMGDDDDDDDDQHHHNRHHRSQHGLLVEDVDAATATPTPSPSPPQQPSSSFRLRRSHPEFPLSPPPLSTPNTSPSKYNRTFVSTMTTPFMKSPTVANSMMPVIKGVEWKRLQPCSVARQDMASTVVLQSSQSSSSPSSNPLGILVVGGRSEELDRAAMETVELLDWSSKRWRTLPSLNQARCGCAVASIEDTFYVFGGVGSSNLEDTSWVETLTMGGKAWIPIVTSPMPHGSRWHPSAVALPFHEEIIVLGGRDPASWNELATVYSFDTEAHQWTGLANMSRPRFACGATRLTDSTLLVCGGYDGTEWTATCEIYDFTTNLWSSDEDGVSSMPLQGLQFVTATAITEEFVLVTGQRDDALLSSSSSGGTNNSSGDSNGGSGGSVWMVYHTAANEWITLPVFPPSIAEEMVGCTVVAVAGKYVLAIGGTEVDGLPTKNTRISTNLMTVLHMAMNGGSSSMYGADEVTVDSYRSNSSSSKRTDPTVGSRESYSHSHHRNGSSNSSLGGGGCGDALGAGPSGAQHSPWTISPVNSSPNAFRQQSNYFKRGSVDSDKEAVSGGASPTTNPYAPPIWAGPVSHIQLVDQSSSVMSYKSGDSTHESQFLGGSYDDALSEEWSASTGMDSASYQLRSPTRPPTQHRSSHKIKRQIVQGIQIVDGNGIHVVYSGHVLYGRPSGKGRMTWENGDSYSGGFKHGQRHGKGCQAFTDGRQYEGRFVSNFAHDPNGSMTWKDGTLYVGAFVQGKRTGSGIQRFPTGVRYEGEFVNGKYHGHGICCFADGSIYNGEWIHGKAHGSGILRDNRGSVLYSGLWQDDSPVNDDD